MLDAMPLDRLQFLDVLIQAAVAVDQQHLAVVPGGGDADRRRQTGANRAEIDRNVVLAGRPAAQVRHRKAEAVPAGDDDVPVLRDRRVEFLDDRARIDRSRRRVYGFGSGFSAVAAIFEAISLLRQPWRRIPFSRSRATIASAAALASAWTWRSAVRSPCHNPRGWVSIRTTLAFGNR
jgi:hypothetical protein